MGLSISRHGSSSRSSVSNVSSFIPLAYISQSSEAGRLSMPLVTSVAVENSNWATRVISCKGLESRISTLVVRQPSTEEARDQSEHGQPPTTRQSTAPNRAPISPPTKPASMQLLLSAVAIGVAGLLRLKCDCTQHSLRIDQQQIDFDHVLHIYSERHAV